MGCFLTTRKEAANLREFSLIFCGARKIRADWRGLADSIPAFWRADRMRVMKNTQSKPSVHS
jgi:hypothetical protein